MPAKITIGRALVAGLFAVFLLTITFPVGAQSADALDLYRKGDYQGAINTTLKEIEADKTNMDSYAVLGWSLNNLRRYSEAIDWANKALQITRTDHRVVGILAEAYFALRQDLTALDYYQRYISLSLNLVGWDVRYLRDAYRDMGEIFLRVGEYYHADMAFATAIAYDKGPSAYDPVRSSRLWLRLGTARELATDKPAAQAAYQAALNIDPNNTEAKAAFDKIR